MFPSLGRTFATVLYLLLASFAIIPGRCQTLPNAPTANVLSLDDALKIALANNRPLNAAARDVTKANDAVAIAHTNLLPVISLKANAGALLDPVNVRIPAGSLGSVNNAPFPTNDATIYSAHGVIGSVDASVVQPITQLPAIRLNVQLQQVGVRVAEEENRGRRIAVLAQVKQTYYAILTTQDSIISGQESLKYDQELERTVADFVAHETVLQADLLDAHTQTAQQELKLAELTDTLAEAKERLNVLLGRDLTTPFEVIMPSDSSVSADDLTSLHDQALKQRPDLRVAALQVRQAEIGERLAHQPNLPAVSLALNYKQLPLDVNGLPNHLWTIGFLLEWTPVDWGKRQSQARQQTQQIDQAHLALTEEQSQALLDVNTKARQYATAQKRLFVAQANQKAAQERLREMTNQYKAKAILLKDVLQQQAATAEANEQEQQTRIQLLAAKSALETAVGDDQ